MSEAKDTLTSLRKALNNTTPTVSYDSSIVVQDSPLLKLPGELKNRIFELVMPTNKTIMLRSEVRRNVDGISCYYYSPSLPPLLAVCRELRSDAAACYYCSNTFLFHDFMFRPKAIEGFVAARGDAAYKIRSAKVTHQHNVFKPFWTNAKGNPLAKFVPPPEDHKISECIKLYTVSFALSAEPQGFNIKNVRSRQRRSGDEWDNMAASQDGLCCCTLQRMVAEYAGSRARLSSSLLAVLCRYVEMVNDHEQVVYLRGIPGAKSPGDVQGKLCEHCRKVKSI